jgi:tetratricopeptide (TPR) repeat protein
MPQVPDPQAAAQEAELLLRRGEPLLAFNAAQEGLREAPGHLRLRQLQALALARSGDAPRAGALLQALVEEGCGDAETLGMLARTHKDLAQRAAGPEDRARHLDAAIRLYERAYREALERAAVDDALYTGINAAATAALVGDLARARAVAAEVRALGLGADGGGAGASSRYWREATLGEAALILGENEAAAGHYARAAKLAEGRPGDLGSTRRQARLLASCLPGADPAVVVALAIAPVLVYTGNMIDAPGRPAPRFPAALEPAVREALRARLAAIRPVAAYGSAACGADLLCLELVREMGGETHVVLPFPAADFRRASVDFAGGDWGARFERALAGADSVTVTSDHRASGSSATFEYSNLVVTGMGRLRARLLEGTLRGLAAWDPSAAGAAGGAASLVPLWEARGIAIDRVDLAALRGTPSPPPSPADAAPEPAVRHEMRAMLFADAVGYSQLSEDQIPGYITAFLGAVAALNARTAHRFEHVETSGDGLYMVFRDAADAGHYALELNALVAAFDRKACGLPANFDLRIALHCGPVHCARDPITGLPIYTGPHTSRAARIEPITPPGQVYASSAFAAVAAAGGADGLQMSYVGRIPLAKGYGTLGLYHVRPAG